MEVRAHQAQSHAIQQSEKAPKEPQAIQTQNTEIAQPPPKAAKQTHSLSDIVRLNELGQAQAHLPLNPDPELDIRSSYGGVRVSGFPAGKPPAFEDVLAATFPNAQSITAVSHNEDPDSITAVYNVDGQDVEVFFPKIYEVWQMPRVGDYIQIRAQEGELPPFQENHLPPKPSPLADILNGKKKPGPAPAPIFEVQATSNGSYSLSFPQGAYPNLKDVIAQIFPDAQNIEVLGTDHTRPFSRTEFSVDGQKYEYSYTWGGIIPGSSASVKPLSD